MDLFKNALWRFIKAKLGKLNCMSEQLKEGIGCACVLSYCYRLDKWI